MVAVTRIISGLSRLVPADLARTNKMLTGALKTGYNKGSVLAKTTNQGTLHGAYTKSKSAVKELKNVKFTKAEIPAVAAAITGFLPIPVPGLSIAVYALGHVIQKGIKFIK